jgi:hypothetical protein
MLIDLIGERFGRLVVLRRGSRRDRRHSFWLCRCDCGKRKQVRGDSLKCGAIKSCGQGCLPRGHSPEDIAGQVFGRLTAIKRMGHTSWRISRWRCQCRCGRKIIARLDQLRDGTTKSCGCWYRDSRPLTIKHGHARQRSHSPIYAAYSRQKSWCRNPNNRRYPGVGGRGIEFRFDSFVEFLAEVGDKPGPDYWLMRNDPAGHFEGGNLGWQFRKKKRKRGRSG